MKFRLRYVWIGLGVLLLAAVIGFVVWADTPLGPSEEALIALRSSADVTVTVNEDYIVFQPVGVTPDAGFVFYPGGRVDYRSYARPLHQIAERGFLVVSVHARLNLMVFDPNKAERTFPLFPEIKHWAVGGHSLGGAMAANYLYQHPDAADGLVLWASYPASNNNLANSELRVLSIYGTLDMAGTQQFDASRSLLPASTKWVVIDGGNHAQFGNYGVQPGDNMATIGVNEQQAFAVAATADFLDSLGE